MEQLQRIAGIVYALIHSVNAKDITEEEALKMLKERLK